MSGRELHCTCTCKDWARDGIAVAFAGLSVLAVLLTYRASLV